MNVLVNGITYPCTKAVKGNDYIKLYDSNNIKIASFGGISDFSDYNIENGDWSSPEPTLQEQLQSQAEAILALMEVLV